MQRGIGRCTAQPQAGVRLDALRKRRATGRPCRLNQEQFREIAQIYAGGPRAAGFDAERWTTARFADAIFTRFGVRYDPDHAGRIMHRLGLRQRAGNAHRRVTAPYTSRYSPNTGLSRSEISPTVA